MKPIHTLIIFLPIILFFSCTTDQKIPAEIVQHYPSVLHIQVSNESKVARPDETILFKISEIQQKYPDFNPLAFVIFDNGVELPSQVIDMDADRQMDHIACQVSFTAHETKHMVIRYNQEGERSRTYPKRTQAEISHKVGGQFQKMQNGRYEYVGGEFKNVDYLRVPIQHSDHSYFIRYEGPGWESDKVGYRFYLDWRNAIDIFGKRTPTLVLQDVGQDGFESYHQLSDWGMDILKVGEALGIGAIGMLVNNKVERVSQTDSVDCQIVANGSLYSQIRTRYFGWQIDGIKIDVISDLSICAGSRMTQHTVTVADSVESLCTGIVKQEGISVIQNSTADQEYGFIATYGRQSLAGDQLGMAIIFRNDDFRQFTEDSHNWIVVFKPVTGRLEYSFLAAWEQEPAGIKTQEEFIAYLNELLEKLSQPVTITL